MRKIGAKRYNKGAVIKLKCTNVLLRPTCNIYRPANYDSLIQLFGFGFVKKIAVPRHGSVFTN